MRNFRARLFLVFLLSFAWSSVFASDADVAARLRMHPLVANVVHERDATCFRLDLSEYGIEGVFLVTAAHTFRGTSLHEAEIQNGNKWVEARLIKIDYHLDLAILITKKSSLIPLTLSGIKPSCSEKLAAYGSNGDEPIVKSTGKVYCPEERIMEPGKKETIHSSIKIERGFSGGPVLNQAQRVVGVIMSRWSKDGTSNYLPADDLTALIEKYAKRFKHLPHNML